MDKYTLDAIRNDPEILKGYMYNGEIEGGKIGSYCSIDIDDPLYPDITNLLYEMESDDPENDPPEAIIFGILHKIEAITSPDQYTIKIAGENNGYYPTYQAAADDLIKNGYKAGLEYSGIFFNGVVKAQITRLNEQ